nr:hypothetical protein [uncultured Mediterranean phage uvMED]
MEEEKKVSEETKVEIPNANPYSKVREEDDAEVEAFAKGELTKFHREQREKEAEAATEQKDTDASEETAEPTDKKATPIAERPAKAEDRVFKKRYDDLKKHYDSTINKHKEELTSLRTQLESSTKQFVPPKSKEELEAWRKEYPDVYDMVETIAIDKATTQTAELENKYKNIQLQQEQIAKEKAEVELLKLHPDFNDIRAKDDFHEWAEQQDPTIQSWLYENTSNSKLAARAIDLYKMDRGQSTLTKKEEKDVKKEAAKAISKTKKATDSDIPKKKIWTTTEISKLKPHQFEKFEKEIDLARLEGRIEQR